MSDNSILVPDLNAVFRIVNDDLAQVASVNFFHDKDAGVEIFWSDSFARGHTTAGVQVSFQNNWRLSIMWGSTNYCAIRGTSGKRSSSTAEVAVISNVDGVFHALGDHDEVRGWITPEVALGMFPIVAGMPSPEHLDRRLEELSGYTQKGITP